MSEPFNPKTALDTIRSILLNDGRLVIRRHCYIRMGERTVDDLDIRRVLEETGTINSKPKWDKKHQKFKYEVNGFDTENEQLTVVVNIVESNWLVVSITTFGE